MRKQEIAALMRAHRGRARPVASLHILRQARLEPDDQTFLEGHADELGPSDLLRWRSRCEPGFTKNVIVELARRAVLDPIGFRHEVLDAPKLDIHEEEWRELAELLRSKIPDTIYAIVLERGGPRPQRDPPERRFTPGIIAPEPLLDDADLDGGAPVDFDEARRLSFYELLFKQRKAKLRISDGDFLAIAMEHAQNEGEDWSLLAPKIPGVLRDAVLEKAARTSRNAERANLLCWLERHDVNRKALLAIALRPAGTAFELGLVDWLARHLTTRSAWDQQGADVIRAFLDNRAFAELGEVVTLAFSAAQQRQGGETRRGFVEAIQSAFAVTLVAMAKQAIVVGRKPDALAALSALVCLDPPSRVSRAVHDLRSLDGIDPDVDELIGVNERMLKHSDARDASLEGIVAALHALADQ
ncbi:MAG: hypothetical protein HOW73_04815 [Polyangiaceae bacterium]|nr:hypothetical protein [Polyangiaceae bacterium]